MEYSYLVGLKLANPNVSIDLQSHSDFISSCVKTYNEAGLERSKNPKYIELDENNVLPDSIVLTLHSTNALKFIGKALRYFSQLLLDNDEFKKCVVNGQLLRTFPVSDISSIESDKQIINVTEIDDLEFIKALLDYVYRKRDTDSTVYRRKKIAFDQMKQIGLESGILKIKNKDNLDE